MGDIFDVFTLDLSGHSPAIHRALRLRPEKAKRAAACLWELQPPPPPPSQPQLRASSSSLPTAALPGRPTENPRPTRSSIPTRLARPTHPHGDLSPGCSGGRPGASKAAGPGVGARRPGGDAGNTGLGGGRELGWDGAAPATRASGATVRPPARPPARSPGLPAKAQETPPPRLHSRSIQTVTAAASPPLPPAAAPRARRLPAATLAPLAPGRSPARPGVAEDPRVPTRGRDRRRPGAEAHPCPGAAQPADSPKPPTPIPQRSRSASLPHLRTRQQADCPTGSRPP
ncbi:translation initiation factor IF-2-like [Apodemus sylvaticus]|uniref:translation initiation factor IF-2-like n=1 Tax=Apodemus sylvaticus TaxID=10129 RepID=UPI0022449745|nr:translation initiation factor IF-2-like [Apodemus sylvaticus]